MIAVRNNTLGGLSAGKFHLTHDRKAAALCGAEASTVAGWLNRLGVEGNPIQAMEDLDLSHALCKRCVKHA